MLCKALPAAAVAGFLIRRLLTDLAAFQYKMIAQTALNQKSGMIR